MLNMLRHSLNNFCKQVHFSILYSSFTMEFDKPQYAQLRKYTGPVASVKVLVVDANSACRAVISKSLLSLGYEGNWHLF
jgi:hypothetical protein